MKPIKFNRDPEINDIGLFVNQHGVLCQNHTYTGMWNTLMPSHTEIGVYPVIDGVAVDGFTIINIDDFHYETQIGKPTPKIPMTIGEFLSKTKRKY